MATTRAQRGRMVFVGFILAMVFALVSVAIGVATADACGDLDATKSWRVLPPGWECGVA
jgi:hypothetical protein